MSHRKALLGSRTHVRGNLWGVMVGQGTSEWLSVKRREGGGHVDEAARVRQGRNSA